MAPPQPHSRMNETARWVEANWPELERQLHSTFMSYFSGTNVRLDIEDWTQEFVAHLIEKDPIPEYLEKNGASAKGSKNLTVVVSYWGFRYVCSHIKRQAMDTVGRLYTGARTERELNRNAKPSQLVPFEELENHEDPGPSPDWSYLVQELAAVTVWWMDMCFPVARDRYLDVLEKVLQGSSVQEIGISAGISRCRAASIIYEIRHRLRLVADTPENFSTIDYVRVA